MLRSACAFYSLAPEDKRENRIGMGNARKRYGGIKSQFEHKAKSDLESLLNPSWFFDCPICGGVESLVAELDFHSDDVVTDRCACVECGFVVGKGAPYISQVVLADQLAEKRATILKEYG
jgi:hypothetical protein